MSKLKPKKSTVRVERSAVEQEEETEPPPPSLILALVEDCSLLPFVASPPGTTKFPLASTRGFNPLAIVCIVCTGSLVLGLRGQEEMPYATWSKREKNDSVDVRSTRHIIHTVLTQSLRDAQRIIFCERRWHQNLKFEMTNNTRRRCEWRYGNRV
jgi:hypothetical protein